MGYLIAPGLDFCDCQFPLRMTESGVRELEGKESRVPIIFPAVGRFRGTGPGKNWTALAAEPGARAVPFSDQGMPDPGERRLVNVRFGAQYGLKSDIAPSPRSADFVAKLF